MLFGAVWVWGGTRWILRLGPPLVVATARSWYSALRRPVMAWVMSQGTTLPTEGKTSYIYTETFDVNAQLCIYISIWRCSTHVRTLHTHIHTQIHINTHNNINNKSILASFDFLQKTAYKQSFLSKHSRWCTNMEQITHAEATRKQTTLSKFASYIYIHRWFFASMHIDGPWRSCFLNVLRYEA